jgi:hypothetical protein
MSTVDVQSILEQRPGRLSLDGGMLLWSGKILATGGVSIVMGIHWMLLGAGNGALESSRSSTKQVPSANKVSFFRTTDPSGLVSLDIVIDWMALPEVCISKSNRGRGLYRVMSLFCCCCVVFVVTTWAKARMRGESRRRQVSNDDRCRVVWMGGCLKDVVAFSFVVGAFGKTLTLEDLFGVCGIE